MEHLSARSIVKFRAENEAVKVIETIESHTSLSSEALSKLLERLFSCFYNDASTALAFGMLGGHKKLASALRNHAEISEEDRETLDEIVAMVQIALSERSIVRDEASKVDKFTFDNHTIYMKVTPNQLHGKGQNAVGLALWPAASLLSRYIVKFANIFHNQSILEIGAGLGLCGILVAAYTHSVTLTDFNHDILKDLIHNVKVNIGDERIEGNAAVIPSHCNIRVCKLDWYAITSKEFGFSFVRCAQYGVSDIRERIHHLLKGTEYHLPESSEKLTLRVSADGKITSESSRAHEGEKGCDGILENPSESTAMDYNDEGAEIPEYVRFEDKLKSSDNVNPGLYDMVIGSDTVCCIEDAAGLARAAYSNLRTNGIILLIHPQPQHRNGTEAVEPALRAIGFAVVSRPIVHSFCIQKYADCLDSDQGDNPDAGQADRTCNDFANSNTDIELSLREDKKTTMDSTEVSGVGNRTEGDRKAEEESLREWMALHDPLFAPRGRIDHQAIDDYMIGDLDEKEYTMWTLVVGKKL
jgi:hypothetical protein